MISSKRIGGTTEVTSMDDRWMRTWVGYEYWRQLCMICEDTMHVFTVRVLLFHIAGIIDTIHPVRISLLTESGDKTRSLGAGRKEEMSLATAYVYMLAPAYLPSLGLCLLRW